MTWIVLFYIHLIKQERTMSPPNADIITEGIEKLDLQSIARKQGHYLVYPETKVCYAFHIH